MPRFYFHFISQDQVSRDAIGTEFHSLEAAYLDACRAALEISMEMLQVRDDPNDDGIEITDENGCMLMHIPFSEVLRPRQTANVQANHRAMGHAIEACRQQMLRSQMLQSELRTEFEKTASIFRAIQTKLAILKAGSWPD